MSSVWTLYCSKQKFNPRLFYETKMSHDYTEFCELFQVDPSAQCEEVFSKYDYRNSGLVDAKEVMIALANFTGAGKDDK